VKARHLVLAMQTHFSDPGQRAAAAREAAFERARQTAYPPQLGILGGTTQEAVSLAEEESAAQGFDDSWSLRFIKFSLVQVENMTIIILVQLLMPVQPLQEALDTDLSTFVTISEINQFTAARPHNWRCARREPDNCAHSKYLP
jgi:hypothetical protein